MEFTGKKSIWPVPRKLKTEFDSDFKAGQQKKRTPQNQISREKIEFSIYCDYEL